MFGEEVDEPTSDTHTSSGTSDVHEMIKSLGTSDIYKSPYDMCKERISSWPIDERWRLKLVHHVRTNLFMSVYGVEKFGIPIPVMSAICELFIDKTYAKVYGRIDHIICTPNEVTMGIFKDFANEILRGINEDNYERINLLISRYCDNNDDSIPSYTEIFELYFSKMFAISSSEHDSRQKYNK